MLPPSYLDQMPDAFVQLWQQVEDEILQDVARRIGKMDAVTPLLRQLTGSCGATSRPRRCATTW